VRVHVGGDVEPVQPLVELAVVFDFLRGIEQHGGHPVRARIPVCAAQARVERVGHGHCPPDTLTFFEDFLLPCIRRERLAFLDAQRLEHSHEETVALLHWVVVDELRELLPVSDAFGFKRIDRFARGGKGAIGLGVVSLAVGVDAQLCHHVFSGSHVAVLHQTTNQNVVVVHRGHHDEITLFRQLPFVARRHKEELATFSRVRASPSDLRYRAEPEIIHHARRRSRWNFEDNRTILAQISEGESVIMSL
jgi:hypothetical protein